MQQAQYQGYGYAHPPVMEYEASGSILQTQQSQLEEEAEPNSSEAQQQPRSGQQSSPAKQRKQESKMPATNTNSSPRDQQPQSDAPRHIPGLNPAPEKPASSVTKKLQKKKRKKKTAAELASEAHRSFSSSEEQIQQFQIPEVENDLAVSLEEEAKEEESTNATPAILISPPNEADKNEAQAEPAETQTVNEPNVECNVSQRPQQNRELVQGLAHHTCSKVRVLLLPRKRPQSPYRQASSNAAPENARPLQRQRIA